MGLFDAVKSVTGAIGDAFNPISGLAGGVASAYGAYTQQQSSEKMAKDQMKFQERMSSTAHRRQVEDLRRAGLNPILSANKGASSPGGAMGLAQNIGGAGVTSALQAQQNRANIQLADAQTRKLGWESDPVTKVKTIMDSLGVTRFEDLPKTMQNAIGLLGFNAKDVNQIFKVRTKPKPGPKKTHDNRKGYATGDIVRRRHVTKSREYTKPNMDK